MVAEGGDGRDQPAGVEPPPKLTLSCPVDKVVYATVVAPLSVADCSVVHTIVACDSPASEAKAAAVSIVFFIVVVFKVFTIQN